MKQKRLLISIGVAIFLLSISLTSAISTSNNESDINRTSIIEVSNDPILPLNGNTYYVGCLGPGCYDTIQDAINVAEDGDTVYVYDDFAPYYENVIVNKSIQLIGEDKNTTIIDGGGIDFKDVVLITADNVTFTGFTVQNSGNKINGPDAGIDTRSYNNSITGNIIVNNYFGIHGSAGAFITISENIIINNSYTGIRLRETPDSIVTGNTIMYNGEVGISPWRDSANTTITENTISYNNNGFWIYSNNNIISNNTITDNYEDGIKYSGWGDNNIVTGNIIKNHLTGIDLDGINHLVTQNRIINNGHGIYIFDTNNNIIDNTILNNNKGVVLKWHGNNTVIGNNISNNLDAGIRLEGRYTAKSDHNRISKNTLVNNTQYGIVIAGAPDHCRWNTISMNTIKDTNGYGLYTTRQLNNNIYCNNFYNNTQHTYDNSTNSWNHTYTIGGNYYDNYTGVDIFSGPEQNIFGSDGVGDTPYNIPGGFNQDTYPLMLPCGEFVTNRNTGEIFTTIQNAIDDHDTLNSHFIIIGSHTYTENIAVDKSLSLTGENSDMTIIDGGGLGNVVDISADQVNLSGFTIQQSGNNGQDSGINIHSNQNTIQEIIVSNNNIGISLQSSNNNIISGNTIQSNNEQGIYLSDSNTNTLFDNIVIGNNQGIYLLPTCNNNIIYNNYFDNNNNAYDQGNNIWNITKTLEINIVGESYLGGNYWHDYIGEDIDFDFIGDTELPYNSNGNITYGGDWRPLLIRDLPVVYVDDDFNESSPGWNITCFDTIQSGINGANENGTVYVFEGIYYENIVVNKSVSLVGENRNSTIINGSGNETAVFITTSWVNINSFTIRNGTNRGIKIADGADDNTVTENTIIKNANEGIHIGDSSNNIISTNYIAYNGRGINLDNYWGAYDNEINGNTVEYNGEYGIHVDAIDTIVYGNSIKGNNIGIQVELYFAFTPHSYGNIISNNNIMDSSEYGIYATETFSSLFNNYIYHNNLINNTQHAYALVETNYGYHWDDGYPSGGNYWGNYTGDDNYSGPDQDIVGSDGIIDELYSIPGYGNNKDNYPLMYPYPGCPFLRGDTNADGIIIMSDVMFLLRYLYVPGSPSPTCLDASDVNDDGSISMTDATYLLKHLYVPDSPDPPLPFPDCDYDPTDDELGCNYYSCMD